MKQQKFLATLVESFQLIIFQGMPSKRTFSSSKPCTAIISQIFQDFEGFAALQAVEFTEIDSQNWHLMEDLLGLRDDQFELTQVHSNSSQVLLNTFSQPSSLTCLLLPLNSNQTAISPFALILSKSDKATVTSISQIRYKLKTKQSPPSSSSRRTYRYIGILMGQLLHESTSVQLITKVQVSVREPVMRIWQGRDFFEGKLHQGFERQEREVLSQIRVEEDFQRILKFIVPVIEVTFIIACSVFVGVITNFISSLPKPIVNDCESPFCSWISVSEVSLLVLGLAPLLWMATLMVQSVISYPQMAMQQVPSLIWSPSRTQLPNKLILTSGPSSQKPGYLTFLEMSMARSPWMTVVQNSSLTMPQVEGKSNEQQLYYSQGTVSLVRMPYFNCFGQLYLRISRPRYASTAAEFRGFRLWSRMWKSQMQRYRCVFWLALGHLVTLQEKLISQVLKYLFIQPSTLSKLFLTSLSLSVVRSLIKHFSKSNSLALINESQFRIPTSTAPSIISTVALYRTIPQSSPSISSRQFSSSQMKFWRPSGRIFTSCIRLFSRRMKGLLFIISQRQKLDRKKLVTFRQMRLVKFFYLRKAGVSKQTKEFSIYQLSCTASVKPSSKPNLISGEPVQTTNLTITSFPQTPQYPPRSATNFLAWPSVVKSIIGFPILMLVSSFIVVYEDRVIVLFAPRKMYRFICQPGFTEDGVRAIERRWPYVGEAFVMQDQREGMGTLGPQLATIVTPQVTVSQFYSLARIRMVEKLRSAGTLMRTS